jgi:hypothetical protein
MSVTRFIGPAAEGDAFVRRQAGWSHFHFHGWRTVLETTYGHEGVYLAAHDSAGSLSGVLPLVRVRSPLFGHFLVSRPGDIVRILRLSSTRIVNAVGTRHRASRTDAARNPTLWVRKADEK